MITNEIKAKVFGQYLGQKVRHEYGGTFYLNGVVSDSINVWHGALKVFTHRTEPPINYKINTLQLLLRPLSEITDEDAIEVAKFELPNRIDFKVLKNDVGIYKVEAPALCAEANDNYKPVDYILINQDWDECGLVVTIDEEPFEYHHYFGVKSCQYLQSKGYDLPHYLLGGKTLKEAGLAIYEPSA